MTQETRFTRILSVAKYSEYRIRHKECHLKCVESIIRNRECSTWSVKKLTKYYHNNWCQTWHDNRIDTEHIMQLSCKGNKEKDIKQYRLHWRILYALCQMVCIVLNARYWKFKEIYLLTIQIGRNLIQVKCHFTDVFRFRLKCDTLHDLVWKVKSIQKEANMLFD